MTDVATLASRLHERLSGVIVDLTTQHDEVTLTLVKQDLISTCQTLRDEPGYEFEQLIDVTAVDYLDYGTAEWVTTKASASGFDRGVQRHTVHQMPDGQPRFSLVYHLLSLSNNQRLRIKVMVDESDLCADSVVEIWNGANWYEREVFDMFGIVFNKHPDLRRIMTDYGFIGHPFRKDFPVSGYVEVRYDARLGRVIYEPVDIEPRTLVPKVIRGDTSKNKREADHV